MHGKKENEKPATVTFATKLCYVGSNHTST